MRVAPVAAVNNRWTGLDWTLVDWTGLEWTGLEKIVSNTDTNNKGLGWKKGHLKTITLQHCPSRVQHKLYMEQPPTVVGVTSKSPGRLSWKRSSATQTTIVFGLGWKRSSKNKCNFVV